MDSYDWLNKLYSFHMATAVIVGMTLEFKHVVETNLITVN